MRFLCVAAVIAFSVGQAAAAPPCRDGKGKFVACPQPAAAKKCRDARGKFAACPAAAPSG